jgi:hypothetical protein
VDRERRARGPRRLDHGARAAGCIVVDHDHLGGPQLLALKVRQQRAQSLRPPVGGDAQADVHLAPFTAERMTRQKLLTTAPST